MCGAWRRGGMQPAVHADSAAAPTLAAQTLTGLANTFPKLLIHNAVALRGRPAIRHKDLGIWHTWTWDQVLDEVRAFSVGLGTLGLQRGDKVAVVGANRPRLYWSMCAVQALGGI